MKRRDEVLVGVFITLAVTVGLLGTIWLARGGLSSGYPLYARFPWGQGLRQGQPVLLTGVNVGYVDAIDLQDNGSLVVTMRINEEYEGRVPEGTTATIEPNGLFGDKLIALRPRGPNPERIQAGDTVPTGQAGTSIDAIIARLDTVSANVSDVTEAIELQLVREGGIADLRRTLAATNQLVTQLSAIAAEQSRQLSLTMTSLRRTANAVDSASVDSTVQNLQLASANVAALTGELRQTTAQLNGVLGRLERGEGTAGRLLSDTLLYRDIRSLVTLLDSVTADFKRTPRRYINLEIF